MIAPQKRRWEGASEQEGAPLVTRFSLASCAHLPISQSHFFKCTWYAVFLFVWLGAPQVLVYTNIYWYGKEHSKRKKSLGKLRLGAMPR